MKNGHHNRVPQGTRLYIGNLPYTMDANALVEAFSKEGFQVSNPHIVIDRESGQSKGFGFVEAASEKDAKDAIDSMNGTQIGGRTVRVDHAHERQR